MAGFFLLKFYSELLYRLKKCNSPIFAYSFGLNISIHRHYTRVTLDCFRIALGIKNLRLPIQTIKKGYCGKYSSTVSF